MLPRRVPCEQPPLTKLGVAACGAAGKLFVHAMHILFVVCKAITDRGAAEIILLFFNSKLCRENLFDKSL